MKYKVKFRVIGDKPPFTVTLHEDSVNEPAVITKIVTTSNIIDYFEDTQSYIISPLKKYCVKAVDSINEDVFICDVDYPIFKLTVLTNQSSINVNYLNISENILNNKLYNIPVGENVILNAIPPQGYSFKNWETTPNNSLNNSTNNPLNFLMSNTNFSIKPINEETTNSFIFTIDTTKGTGSSFDLPLISDYNYNFVVDWGDNTTSTVTSFDDVNKSHTYSTGGEYQIKINGLCESISFIMSTHSNKLVSVDQWGDVGFINMNQAFSSCNNLTSVYDNNGDWSSNVTTMNGMFYQCGNLSYINLSNWNVSNVTDMSYMFYQCSSLTTLDVSNWDVSNVTNMRNMFRSCSLLTTLHVSNWDVSNVTDMSYMFYQCSSLTTLDVSNWNVSNVTNMRDMFGFCSSLTPLDVSTWDVSNVTNMSGMFSYCSSLTTLHVSNWDVSNITDMGGMFYQCFSLTTLDVSNWNVSNVTNMKDMFYICSSLQTLDVSNWNVSNITDMASMFTNVPLDRVSYDALLIEWSKLSSLQPNLTFGANLAKYSAGVAAYARQYIIDTYGWTISDGGQVYK